MANKESVVYVIDDDPLIGQAIQWLLDTVNLKVETFQNAAAFLQAFNPKWYGCLLIDVRMPGMSGLELQKRLNEMNNLMPIIILTGHGDVPMAVQTMQEGAKDFILKPFNDQLLIEKIQVLIAKDLQRDNGDSITIIQQRFQTLTARERQVMQHMVDGKLSKQIAAELVISLSTVEFHRARIMQKMAVKSIADLVKSALALKEN